MLYSFYNSKILLHLSLEEINILNIKIKNELKFRVERYYLCTYLRYQQKY